MSEIKYDLQTGDRFGKLVVISLEKRYVRTHCDCGTEQLVRRDHLISGATKSCGCLGRELLSRRMTTHGHTAKRSTSPTYRSWRDMIQRCTNSRRKDYGRYGGRSIKVCQRWIGSFENFLSDLGPRTQNRTLDRIDVNGDYCPSNCRWATVSEQNKNKRPHPLRSIAAKVVSEYDSGMNQYQLADRYSVSQAFISELISQTKKCVTGVEFEKQYRVSA